MCGTIIMSYVDKNNISILAPFYIAHGRFISEQIASFLSLLKE